MFTANCHPYTVNRKYLYLRDINLGKEWAICPNLRYVEVYSASNNHGGVHPLEIPGIDIYNYFEGNIIVRMCGSYGPLYAHTDGKTWITDWTAWMQ